MAEEHGPIGRDQQRAADADRQQVADRLRVALDEGRLTLFGIWAVTSLASGHLTTFWPGIPLAIWGVAMIAGLITGPNQHHRHNPEDPTP